MSSMRRRSTCQTNVYKEVAHWRKNKTESHRLAEAHGQFERELATWHKARDREAERLQHEIGATVAKASPSVDEYLGRKLQRYDDFRAKERARHDKRYYSICKDNMRKFKQLEMPSVRDMAPEMIEILFSENNKTTSNSGTAKRRDSKTKSSKRDEQSDGTEYESELKIEISTAENKEDATGDGTDENVTDEEEAPETPDWFPGRRRFTLAALNETGQLADVRRASTGSTCLAAILEVKPPQQQGMWQTKKSDNDRKYDTEAKGGDEVKKEKISGNEVERHDTSKETGKPNVNSLRDDDANKGRDEVREEKLKHEDNADRHDRNKEPDKSDDNVLSNDTTDKNLFI